MREDHVNTSLRIHSSTYSLEKFPFEQAFREWKDATTRRGVLVFVGSANYVTTVYGYGTK